MTPKEKARELYTKAEDFIYTSNAHFAEEDAEKNCATMIVDEILDLCQDQNFSGFTLYWEDVKREIKLIE